MNGGKKDQKYQTSLRLDKWLWHARIFKSRSLASKFCQSGKIRVNGETTRKAHHIVRPGDVLTFPLGHHIRVFAILELGTRRGPAAEAQALYEDLQPPTQKPEDGEAAVAPGPAMRDPGAGRPTKSDRRAIDRLMGRIKDRFFGRKSDID
ncbi:MAG: RNA-binding S4 domain-containing protein [Rhodospirillales bacterium]|nr:RNA-binding S4 domain-containing protein [Rhodospirillales bacterium]